MNSLNLNYTARLHSFFFQLTATLKKSGLRLPLVTNCFVTETHAMDRCFVMETHAMRLYNNSASLRAARVN